MTLRTVRFIFVQSLTLVRLPLILVFLGVNLFVHDMRAHAFWFGVAFYSMVLSALTDLFDGYFARRWNMVTSLGAHADPLTDKFFYLVAFPTLVFRSVIQGEPFVHSAVLLTLVVVCLVRDQWVSFLRSIGAIYQISGAANWSGKARTLILFPMICCIYWYLCVPPDWRIQLASWFIYTIEAVGLAITLITIQVYTRRYWPALRRELEKPPK